MICAICARSPDDSFTPRMLSICERRTCVSARHVHARAARDVVHDARQRHRPRDRLEVAVEALLRRPAVVRARQQHRVYAQPLRLARQLDALGGVVRPGAGDHNAARPDRLLDLGEQPHLLVVRERRRLAGRAGEDDAVAAGVEEREGEALGLGVVHRPVASNGVTIAVSRRPISIAGNLRG